jgi:flagellum-specific peptidoglycan hydrolase FlgJ
MTLEQIKLVIQRRCIKAFADPVIPWDLDQIAAALLSGSEKYHVEVELALAQGILEGHFACNPAAKRSRKTRNIFNVGNVDNGGNRFFNSFEAGIDAYFRLLAREYCWRAEGNTVTVDMMLRHDFTRPRGGRYATAPNYTASIRSIVESIRSMADGKAMTKPKKK